MKKSKKQRNFDKKRSNGNNNFKNIKKNFYAKFIYINI